MAILKKLPLILLIAITVSFLLSNREIVTLGFFPLPQEISMPLFLVLILAMMCGMFLGYVQSLRKQLQLKQQITQLRKEREALHVAGDMSKAADAVAATMSQLSYGEAAHAKHES